MLKKRKKNGFTLVELLAVIVILAVVILIAVTAVIPRMNNAKKKALLDEALMYLKAAKESIVFDGDQSPSCINVSNLNDNYIKKSSDSYTGVVKNEYVNGELSQTINLTNGSLYIVGTDNLTSADVKSTMPKGFAASCGDYNPILAENADTNTLAYKLLMSEGGSTIEANLSTINARTENVNFNQIENTAANSGLYKMEDDDGASFYFRGKVDNNWVEFAGFYWRVIRINGDGSIRMIYTGLASSNHTGDNANVKNVRYGDITEYNNQTKDISGLTQNLITTKYSNGRFGNTYVGFMYNPNKILSKYPKYELNTTKTLYNFPKYTNIGASTQYYFFKNFDLNEDCFLGSGADETGTCTLKCRSLNDDCKLSVWNTLATTEGNYSTTADGIYPATNPTDYVYTNDYKYTCWGGGTPVTVNNSDGTTSVYVSCPIVAEILGTVKNQATQARVRYHGIFSSDEIAANTNVKNNNIKLELENWYEANIYNKKDGTLETSRYYEEYLSDEIFCNDRSATASNKTFPLRGGGDFVYDAYSRLVAATKKPTLKCYSKANDAFTMGNGETSSIVTPKGMGNGLLKYPIGLINADEYTYAGGGYGSVSANSSFYLYTGTPYWTMTPYAFLAVTANAYLWYSHANGYIVSAPSSSSHGLRPVINLKSSVLYDSGSGTEADPYKVKLAS